MDKVVFTYIKDGKLKVIVSTVDGTAIAEILHLIDERTVI